MCNGSDGPFGYEGQVRGRVRGGGLAGVAGDGGRADAERQARIAKAARDAIREAHERAIEKALADGERTAAESMTAVCAAIRTLRDLCGSNAEVAELCGVPVADVRELLAVARAEGIGLGDASAQDEPGPSEVRAEVSVSSAGSHVGDQRLPGQDEPGLR